MCAVELQWTAPEILRAMNPAESRRVSTLSAGGGTQRGDRNTCKSTPEADIYAMAIIMKEVFARNGPYTEYEDDMTARGSFQNFYISIFACLSVRFNLSDKKEEFFVVM